MRIGTIPIISPLLRRRNVPWQCQIELESDRARARRSCVVRHRHVLRQTSAGERARALAHWGWVGPLGPARILKAAFGRGDSHRLGSDINATLSDVECTIMYSPKMEVSRPLLKEDKRG